MEAIWSSCSYEPADAEDRCSCWKPAGGRGTGRPQSLQEEPPLRLLHFSPLAPRAVSEKIPVAFSCQVQGNSLLRPQQTKTILNLKGRLTGTFCTKCWSLLGRCIWTMLTSIEIRQTFLHIRNCLHLRTQPRPLQLAYTHWGLEEISEK